MSAKKITSPFSDVDRASDPGWCIDKLDAQLSSEHVFQRKRYAFGLLGVRPGDLVLDAGCGTGWDTLELAALCGDTGFTLGIDRSFKMISESKSRAQEVSLRPAFALQDLRSLGLQDNTFDRCFAERVFQHINAARQALSELVRVTKKGGTLVIVEPDHELVMIDTPYKEITRRFLQWRSDTLAAGDVAHRLYGWLKEFGCSQVSVELSPQVFTDYTERRKVAPYLDEIRIAQERQVVTKEEAEEWSASLEKAIAQGRFLCAQISILTIATK